MIFYVININYGIIVIFILIIMYGYIQRVEQICFFFFLDKISSCLGLNFFCERVLK